MAKNSPDAQALLERSQRLLEINREISATLDLKALLQSIVEAAAELTHSEQASILEYDRGERCLRFIAARWMEPEIMEKMRVPINTSVSGQAFREKKPVIVHNTQVDERFFSLVDQQSGFKTHSLLSVPMIVRGQATGVLSAVNKLEGESFNDDDLYVMETLASQAAIAIYNAELLKTSQDAFDQLSELDDMKSNFVAITSHELRIPLGLVLGHASYLKEIVEDEALKQVEVIERAALRLKDIVEDLSRIQTMQSEQNSLRIAPVNIVTLLKDLLADMNSSIESSLLTVTTDLPEGKLVVEGEADKLATVFEHLIRNAITFTDPGGHIEVSAEDAGDSVLVHVGDTGVGIPPEDQQRIFERFYQVEAHMTRRHGGMGLGLAVSKMLVEMHQGHIDVQSVADKGSQFTVRLPKTQTIDD